MIVPSKFETKFTLITLINIENNKVIVRYDKVPNSLKSVVAFSKGGIIFLDYRPYCFVKVSRSLSGSIVRFLPHLHSSAQVLICWIPSSGS